MKEFSNDADENRNYSNNVLKPLCVFLEENLSADDILDLCDFFDDNAFLTIREDARHSICFQAALELGELGLEVIRRLYGKFNG